MSSLIFKGKDSQKIDGLLISELPDITRPPRRQEVIEVDGRDGDVVNYLGYDTYKKTLRIGLYGDYNVDQISDFFSGAGDLILSNEPDKKYSARIVDAIDFERLIRFKTAKVTFIVQPYKKLITEAVVTGDTSPLTVKNRGYEDSKPTFIIQADADEVIEVDVNGVTVFSVTMPAEETITIDGEAQNCYNTNADKNQYVTGDFATFISGDNTVSWTGTATITVIPNSRWL